MPASVENAVVRLLRWSEKYTKTDMVYLAESGFWLNLTNVVLSAAAFGLYVVFANVLPKEVYGTYQYFLSISAVMTSFTLTGMNLAVTQSIPRGYLGTFRSALIVQLRFGAIALLVSFAGALYYLSRGNAEIATALLIIGLFVPLLNSFNTFTAYYAGTQKFKEIFSSSMAIYLPTYGLLAVAAYMYADALVLLLVNLVLQTVLMAIICRIILAKVPASEPSDPEAMRFGKQLSALNFFGAAVGQFDNILAFHFLGPVPLAIYSFATAIPDRVGGLLKFVTTAALPKFAVRPVGEIRNSILGKVWRIAIIAVIASGLYALAAPTLFKIIFPQYLESIPYSQLYALTILSYATNIFVAAMISHRQTKEYAVFNIGTSVTQSIIQLLGIIGFGLWGLIVGKIISNLLSGAVAGVLFMFVRENEDATTSAQ